MERGTVKRNLFETGQEPQEEQPAQSSIQEPVKSTEPQVIIDDAIDEEAKTWDKEKAVNSYRKLQKIVSDHQVALAQEQELRIRAEERAKLLEEIGKAKSVNEPVKPEEVIPTKPVKPAKPVGYNKADAIAYPDSDSAKYEEAVEKYYEDKETYDSWRESKLTEQLGRVVQTFEQKKNEEIANQEKVRRKAEAISRIAKSTGGDIEKATKVFEFAQKTLVADESDWYVKLYEASLQGNVPSIPKPGNGSIGRVPPAGTLNTNLNTSEESGTFMNELKARRGNHHSLFKTEPK